LYGAFEVSFLLCPSDQVTKLELATLTWYCLGLNRCVDPLPDLVSARTYRLKDSILPLSYKLSRKMAVNERVNIRLCQQAVNFFPGPWCPVIGTLKLR
jgi:hypothetical protein